MAAQSLEKMGYRYLAIGGMVPLASPEVHLALKAIRPAVGDHPADVLAGERRELDGAADVFRRRLLQRLEIGVGALEALEAQVELAEELGRPAGAGLDDPATQRGETLEHAVVDHGGQEHLGREGQHHIVGEAQVLAAAVQVGRPFAAVVAEGLGLGLGAWPDVQDERDVGLAQPRPDRIQVGMARRHLARGTGRDPDGAVAGGIPLGIDGTWPYEERRGGMLTDGQVLVTPDLLGWTPDFRPKFVRRYAELGEIAGEALGRFVADVRGGGFPDEGESWP